MNEISDGICGTHLQIMVRTRGLGRALGHVTGRGVGRGDRVISMMLRNVDDLSHPHAGNECLSLRSIMSQWSLRHRLKEL